jgi:Skp family chaperone for outer membrane proteins
MKKMNLVFLSVLAFGLGYSANNIAVSDTNLKIAVVDTAEIISNSSEVKALKSEQQAKMQEMQTTLQKAREEISKEADAEKAAKLEEKYRDEINRQKRRRHPAATTQATRIGPPALCSEPKSRIDYWYNR